VIDNNQDLLSYKSTWQPLELCEKQIPITMGEILGAWVAHTARFSNPLLGTELLDIIRT